MKKLKFETDYTLKPIAKKNDNGVLNWNTGNFVDEIYIDVYSVKYLKKHYGLKSFEVNTGLVSKQEIDSEKVKAEYSRSSLLHEAKA